MIVVHDITHIHRIETLEIKELVQQRIDALKADGFDVAELGYFLVVEPGDTLEALSAQVGFPILCNRFTGICWDQPDFTPSFELVEEFPACFDLVFVLGQDGAGIEVFVPKAEGVNHELLAMCQRYAMQGEP